MHRKMIIFVFSVIALSGLVSANSELNEQALIAVSGNADASARAIVNLRSQKQHGLDAVLKTYATEIDKYKKSGARTDQWNRISSVIDAVAMQKDAYSSGLFWQTDLEQAKLEAAKTNRPILSLRLLGNLNEEYSCANSRFFRAILYTDPAIAKTLREKYVLHWESVRPAPKVTIDFGDGRKIVSTVTGNSIHYVLNKNGIIIDGLPGLYDPATFNGYLKTLSNVANNPRMLRAADRYRETKARELTLEWESQLDLLGVSKTPQSESETAPRTEAPSAVEAAPIAVTKMATEISLVSRFSAAARELDMRTSFADWKKLAEMRSKVELSPESIAFMGRQLHNPNPSEFESLIAKTKDLIAIDTVQNEFRFHINILGRLNPVTAADVYRFNENVYANLFLTPRSDPWFGLSAGDIYTAIDKNGIVESTGTGTNQ